MTKTSDASDAEVVIFRIVLIGILFRIFVSFLAKLYGQDVKYYRILMLISL